MKSKSANVIDNSLGIVLIFACIWAVCSYFMISSIAAAFALTLTAAFLMFSKFLGLKKLNGSALSNKARNFFEQLIFLPENYAIDNLYTALKNKGYNVEKYVDWLICENTAVFFYFELTKMRLARACFKSNEQKCRSTLILCQSLNPDAGGISNKINELTILTYENCFKFFDSLKILPKAQMDFKSRPNLKAIMAAAFNKNKAGRYFCFSIVLALFSLITEVKIILLVCCGVMLIMSALCLINITRIFKKIKR